MAEKLVSKSGFARLIDVHPSRVTDYIKHGKIGPDAIIGGGRHALIRVEEAKAQLRGKLDSGQRFGNGLGTKLQPFKPAKPTSVADELEPTDVLDDNLDAEIKRERLLQLQRLNRKAAEDEAASQGRYTDTLAARRQMGIVAVQTMRIFEGALPEVATAVASRFAVEERDVLQLLNEVFRTIRLAAAEKGTAAAEMLPSLVSDESPRLG